MFAYTMGLNTYPYRGALYLRCPVLIPLYFIVVHSWQSWVIVGRWWWWSCGHGPVSGFPGKYWSSKL